MSLIDAALKANEEYARTFHPEPARQRGGKIAVLACKDARMDIFRILGLRPGEAYVMRNGGGIVDDGAMRSLIIAAHVLGATEFMLIHHTDCGMTKFKDEALFARLRHETGTSVVAPARFYAFSSVEEDLREQVEKVTSHPWVPKSIPVRGFIYDVETGKLRELSR